jgi:Flp pilus assembly protein CpaB
MNAPDFNSTRNIVPPARRSVGRARSLPSGRAAIGALLVVLSGLGLAFAARQATAQPTTRFAVATRDIPLGDVLEADDVRMLVMTLAPDVARRSFTNPVPLVGAVAVSPMSSGELIQYSAVQAGGPSLRAMSFPIETETVLQNLRVISISGASLDPGSSSLLVVTVAIENPAQQARLAQAVNTGQLFVVRANDSRPSDSRDTGNKDTQTKDTQTKDTQ